MIAPTEQVAGKETSKPRITIPAPKISSREEAEAVLLGVAKATNEKIKSTAAMDAELLAVKAKYQTTINGLTVMIEGYTQRLADYANDNPEIFSKDRKSVEWLAGKFGFRTNSPSLQPINRKFTWAKILGVISAKKWRRFVRVKAEVDKEAILKHCGTLEKPKKFQEKVLPLLGLKLVQEEQFYVEPDLTKVAEVEVKL